MWQGFIFEYLANVCLPLSKIVKVEPRNRLTAETISRNFDLEREVVLLRLCAT